MSQKFKNLALFSFMLFAADSAQANTFERDRAVILRQTGCYLVDYSFTETESLKEGYVSDERVYDSNSDKSTYELIVAVEKAPNEIRLQHLLFLKDLQSGAVRGLMKHHAEDWAYEAPFAFDFVSPGEWLPKAINEAGRWTRKITALDDGIRYQCAAPWDHSKFNPEWNCANFAPIPGRETRDMGRRDYQALDRSTRLIAYENSWVERQNNVKMILNADSTRTPMARELGRTWYVRQPDAACAAAKVYFDERKTFWSLLMNVWEEYLGKNERFAEMSKVNGDTRYGLISEIEEDNFARAHEPIAAEEIKGQIRSTIETFRKPN